MAMNGTGFHQRRFPSGNEKKCFCPSDNNKNASVGPSDNSDVNVSVDEKLAWLFKLYDKDSNGEIVQEEMEDIFLKLCRKFETF